MFGFFVLFDLLTYEMFCIRLLFTHIARACGGGGEHTSCGAWPCNCKTLGENDPMMTTWQQHGYDSAWAPTDAGGRGAGLEENCIKDPKRIKIINAIAVHTTKLEQAGYKIEECGKIVKVK